MSQRTGTIASVRQRLSEAQDGLQKALEALREEGRENPPGWEAQFEGGPPEDGWTEEERDAWWTMHAKRGDK